MSAEKQVKARLAEILEIPSDQAKASPLLQKLVFDSKSCCIVINTNTKKIFSLRDTSSYMRIK